MKAAEVDVREEAADGAPARLLVDHFFAEMHDLYPDFDPARQPPAPPGALDPPEGCFLVAYAGGEAVGCGGFRRLDPDSAEVRRVYVAPSARGRGVGRALMHSLESRARELGYRRLRLDTGSRQPEALVLFRSFGFREIPDYNGNQFATFWMERELA